MPQPLYAYFSLDLVSSMLCHSFVSHEKEIGDVSYPNLGHHYILQSGEVIYALGTFVGNC